MPLLREKRIALRGAQFAVALEVGQVERLRRTVPYQFFVRPALNWLSRRGTNGNGAHTNGTHTNGVHVSATSIRPAPTSPEAKAILARTEGLEWYHTLNLPHGVSTPGYVDHRAQVPLYGLPEDMRGMRALDVATYDGFWAFEMERRGAEVTAIDLESLAQCDFPRRFRHQALAKVADQKVGAAFFLAHELLGSKVERKVLSVYELSPEKVGTFDVVFLSDLLLHLRDPARALENVCSVTKEGGFAIIAEPYHVDLEGFQDLPLSQFGFEQAVGWWQHSAATLKTMMWAAGFDRVDEVSRFPLNCKATIPLTKVVLRGHPGPGMAGGQ